MHQRARSTNRSRVVAPPGAASSSSLSVRTPALSSRSAAVDVVDLRDIGVRPRIGRVQAQVKEWQLQARDKFVRTADSVELSR
jgi:hypothetical protein